MGVLDFKPLDARWCEARVEGVGPERRYFVDLLMVTPGTQAFAAIADLVRQD